MVLCKEIRIAAGYIVAHQEFHISNPAIIVVFKFVVISLSDRIALCRVNEVLLNRIVLNRLMYFILCPFAVYS